MADLNDCMKLSDKASWHHDYVKYYEKHLSFLKYQHFSLLELGIGGEDKEEGGYSLKGWRDYFPYAYIYGVDIFNKSSLDSTRLTTIMADQADEEMLKLVINSIGNPFVIIDDASHISKLTIKSFEILFPFLESGGFYCVEDLSCSFRHDFNEPGQITTFDYFQNAAKSLCNPEFGDPDYERPTIFEEIDEMFFSNELLIIRKK